MSEKDSPLRPTSAIIEGLVEVRDERRAIADRDKVLVAAWKSLEEELMGRLDEQGMMQAKVGAGTASITEVIVPNVVDWDALQAHIQETGDFHLLQKRPAAAAFRELNASGESIPGMEPFNKRTISLRKK
jgi:hypothetical protein